jgi:cytochrome P450
MTRVASYHDVAAVLHSPSARQALHRDSLLAAEIGPGPSDVFVGESVISLHGDEHFNRRRLESRLFTKTARARLELETVVPALQSLLDSARGREADLMVFSRLILVRASGAVVGLALVEDVETADRLRVLGENIVSAIGVAFVTENEQEIFRVGLESLDAFKQEFYYPARQRLTDAAGDDGGLLALLVRNPASVASEAVMFREAVLYLVASSNTTTNALPHAISDVERWLADHPDRRHDMTSFAFCRRVANEALRLHPPVPRLLRRMIEPITLPGGLELDEGEFVALDLVSSSRDPEVFGDDANEFNPFRDVPPGIWRFGFTFGGGTHMCIGRTLVLGDAATTEREEEPQGLFPRLLHDLYKAGLELDEKRPPKRREGTVKDEYVSFPVRFSGPES